MNRTWVYHLAINLDEPDSSTHCPILCQDRCFPDDQD